MRSQPDIAATSTAVHPPAPSPAPFPSPARSPSLLLLSPALAGGGAERVMTHLANHIDRQRFRVTLGLGRVRGQLLGSLGPHVPVVKIGATREVWKGTLLLARYLVEHRPRLVFATLNYSLFAALAKTLTGFDFRLIVRESTIPSHAWFHPGQASRWRARFLRWSHRQAYAAADAVVCQSDAMAADIAAHFPWAAPKLHRIYNPVDAAAVHRHALAPPADWPRGPGRQLLAIGSHRWVKGYDLLLPAFREVLQTHKDVHLTILGQKRPPLSDELEQLAQQLGIGTRVHFLDFVENPYAYVARADAVVLSSRFEGLPNAVIEALAAGTPVVATDCPGGTRELIEPGVNGLLCAVEPSAIAAAIRQGLDEFPALDRHAIRDAAVRRHDVATVVRHYEQLFDDVLAAPPPSPPA